MKRIFQVVAGIALVSLGVVGCLLPFLPGWPFLLAGLTLIAPRFAARLKKKFIRKFFKKEVLRIEDWIPSGVRASVTTRHFGLVLRHTDELKDPRNQETFLSRFSDNYMKAPNRFFYLNQVHEDRIAVIRNQAETQETFTRLEGTDGVITDVRSLGLLVMTADCLGVFFQSGSWIGLAHAGWRGTQKEICRKMLEIIAEKSGKHPAQVRVIFGPCIRACHYEVGSEFKERFSAQAFRERDGKLYFDLPFENKRQLLEAGALEQNILDYEICTVCQKRDFYSYRNEKEAAGRMISMIAYG